MKQKLLALRALSDRKVAQSAAAVAAFVASGGAMAAVPEGVTTALAGALTDVGVVGTAVFLIVVAIAVWRYLKRTT